MACAPACSPAEDNIGAVGTTPGGSAPTLDAASPDARLEPDGEGAAANALDGGDIPLDASDEEHALDAGASAKSPSTCLRSMESWEMLDAGGLIGSPVTLGVCVCPPSPRDPGTPKVTLAGSECSLVEDRDLLRFIARVLGLGEPESEEDFSYVGWIESRSESMVPDGGGSSLCCFVIVFQCGYCGTARPFLVHGSQRTAALVRRVWS
jgi:hypothetical protein